MREPRDVGPFPDFEDKRPHASRRTTRRDTRKNEEAPSGGDGGLLTHKNLGNYRRNMVFPAETGRISARIFLEKRKILENFRFFAISSCPNYRLLCYGYIRRRYGQI